MGIKKGDTVEVIRGEYRGERGTVHQVVRGRRGGRHLGRDANQDRVIVSGINLIKKHQRRTGDVRTQFGIIERESPVHISNVALVCTQCNEPTRVGYHVFPDGSKARRCKKCGELIDA
ncbi:MAG: 50S ribosomal protein L24 [Chloroflexi bacterium]|nr:50S ribosomal protein L24 [Chloroflexota bacterium]